MSTCWWILFLKANLGFLQTHGFVGHYGKLKVGKFPNCSASLGTAALCFFQFSFRNVFFLSFLFLTCEKLKALDRGNIESFIFVLITFTFPFAYLWIYPIFSVSVSCFESRLVRKCRLKIDWLWEGSRAQTDWCMTSIFQRASNTKYWNIWVVLSRDFFFF